MGFVWGFLAMWHLDPLPVFENSLFLRVWLNGQRPLHTAAAAAAAKSLQSCPTLCDPIDGSPPGSSVPGIPRPEHWSGLPCTSPVHESEE